MLTHKKGVEDGETDEQLVEGLLEVGSAEDDDGGAVEEQPAHADEHGEDPLEDGAPELRRPRHQHAAGQVGHPRRRGEVCAVHQDLALLQRSLHVPVNIQ